jgi:hypothetical protein
MWNAECCRLRIVFLSANVMVAKQSHPVKRCFLCVTEFQPHGLESLEVFAQSCQSKRLFFCIGASKFKKFKKATAETILRIETVHR